MIARRIDVMVNRVNMALLLIAVVFLIMTVSIVIANVMTRYVFHISLTWSAELARYSMIWSALLAAAVLVGKKQHLVVDFFGKSLRGGRKLFVELTTGVGSMTFYLIMLISGSILVYRTAGQVASSIEWLPMNLVYIVIPVSALIMLLESGATLWSVLQDDNE